MNSPQRTGTSPKLRKTLLVGLAALAAASAVAVVIVPRTLHGHGHWHQFAKSLYHEITGSSVQAAALPAERADGPMVIYTDKLGDGWADWSWCDRDLASKSPVHTGSAALLVKPKNFSGLSLHHGNFSTRGYATLQLYVMGDPRSLLVALPLESGSWGTKVALAKYCRPATGGWQVARIPLEDLGADRSGATITGLIFQTASAQSYPAISLDDISLLPDTSLPTAPTTATVSLTVDAATGRHPISPYIYGMAFAPPEILSDLKISVNRWGGNDKTRYNWVQGNADNAARDWGYRNRYASDGSVPAGISSAADRFVRSNSAAGAATLLTVPTIGWVARDDNNSHASANVPNAGGTGLQGADGPIAGYDPAANRLVTSVRSLPRKNAPFTDRPTLASGTIYQDEWIAHLQKTFGTAGHGGVQFFSMDNEPDIWDYTHTDVHPARMGYDDVLKNFLDYSTAVKDVAPNVMVTGPVSWGWTGYVFSAKDRGDDNFATHADRTAHGGEMFLPWFLKQVHAHDVKAGKRSLDILDVHYYPQASGTFGGQTDKDTQALRLRSTRSLWDPTYKDESWVATQLYIIPRLQRWVTTNYPGTKIGITEWNFGADDHINGGLTIADVLGIYGRENLYLANYWAYPAQNGPGYQAFKLFRNADGLGHGFGDIACTAVSTDQSKLSCYAATDSSTGDLTLMLINKMTKATVSAPMVIAGFDPAGTVKMWRCDADNPRSITVLPKTALKRTIMLPPQSITLLRIPTQK